MDQFFNSAPKKIDEQIQRERERVRDEQVKRKGHILASGILAKSNIECKSELDTLVGRKTDKEKEDKQIGKGRKEEVRQTEILNTSEIKREKLMERMRLRDTRLSEKEAQIEKK